MDVAGADGEVEDEGDVVVLHRGRDVLVEEVLVDALGDEDVGFRLGEAVAGEGVGAGGSGG
jgi:hypothetical protein